MWSTPLRPATRLSQVVGTSFPTGVTAPRPVITARRIVAWDGRSARTVAVWLRPDLAVADHHVLAGGQLFQAQRPARVQPVRGDADLGAHAVDGTVCEAGGGVHVHRGGVDLAGEPLGGGRVLGHDRLGVAGGGGGVVGGGRGGGWCTRGG